MSDIIIKYFFQNSKDREPNHLILSTKKYHLITIRDIVSVMLHHRLIDRHCYMRFKDYMDDQLCWVDIRNDNAPFPINKNSEVEIKILRVPYYLFDESYDNKNFYKTVKGSKNSVKEDKPARKEERKSKLDNGYQEVNKKAKDIRIGLESELFKEDPEMEGYQKMDDEPKPKKKSSHSFDFLNDKFEDKAQKPVKKQKENDEFDIFSSNLQSKKNSSAKKEDGGLLDLGYSNTHFEQNRYKGDFREVEQQRQKDKMNAASYAEPKIKAWAYNSNNQMRKDIRTLLSTLKMVLWPEFNKWKHVTISDIVSESALKKVVMQAKLKLHPDKNKNLSPEQLYILERVISEINDAFKEYKKMK